MKNRGFLALTRFGFGPRGDGDLVSASLDPRGFLRAELQTPGAALLAGPGLPGVNTALQTLFAEEDAKKAERERLAQNLAAQNNPTVAMRPPRRKRLRCFRRPTGPSPDQLFFRANTHARLNRAYLARAGVAERLVAFWSNHFALSVAKGGPTRASASAFEREAIRPYVLGKFSDMLLAVESHPAVLFYLDNQQSIGPTRPPA